MRALAVALKTQLRPEFAVELATDGVALPLLVEREPAVALPLRVALKLRVTLQLKVAL